uniref:Uncharacterized protein pph33 n=1 Tax=Pseudomonas savastanoi pv. phaseolicola TaxID=319 RepID=Q4LBM4_PSESH|nr:hypothetical protein [Pseudomonas savastanoi pv. phaseolicola]
MCVGIAIFCLSDWRWVASNEWYQSMFSRCRDAFVNGLRRNGGLDQCFVVIADHLSRTWRSTVNTPGL